MHLEKIESHTKITLSGKKIAQTQSSSMQLSPESPSSKNVETTKFSLHHTSKSLTEKETRIPSPCIHSKSKYPLFSNSQFGKLNKTLFFLSQQIKISIQLLCFAAQSLQTKQKVEPLTFLVAAYLSSLCLLVAFQLL